MLAGFWRASPIKLPVLLYHHVGPQREHAYPGLTISPDKFERQIGWLARRGFVGISPSDWLRHYRDGAALPDKPILITFDDGYADTATYALPVLRRYGFSAAIFVVTGFVGKTNSWDQAKGWGSLALMDTKQIRYWASEGIEFGAHTRTHRDLTKLSDGDLFNEISGSKKDLEHILGTAVHSFAYPYGGFNEKIANYVQGNFGLAFSTERGVNRLCNKRSCLKRINVEPNHGLALLHLRTQSEMFWTLRKLRPLPRKLFESAVKLFFKTEAGLAFNRNSDREYCSLHTKSTPDFAGGESSINPPLKAALTQRGRETA